MKRLHRPAPSRSLVYALYVNAAILLAILVSVWSRGQGAPSAAFAAPLQPPPIAGGGSLYLMPAQFSPSNWGCYVMDIDAQTLCAYQYFPTTGKHPELRLVAARRIGFDHKLWDFNSSEPSWREVQRLVELQSTPVRGSQNNAGKDASPHVQDNPAPQDPDAGAPAQNDRGNQDVKDGKH